MGSYVPNTEAQREEMLATCGLSSVDDLYAIVPPESRITGLDLPAGLSEMEVRAQMQALADENQRFSSVFRGAGAYRHYIPAIVTSVTSKEEFVTTYTPYQAEISQGVLQSIFEYQTQICELTGMDVSNASVYDGATAAAEAVLMCLDRKHTGVIMSGTTNPQVITVVKTYCESRGVPVSVVAPKSDLSTDLDALSAAMGEDIAAVYVQSPNFYGVIEDMDAVVSAAHGRGAKVVMGFNPIALGLLRTPGEMDVDIAVGEGQPLGLPLSFGGPYLGIMCARHELMRKLPGRIVGETADARGNRCYVLTLQAREQHIRREKASSNICSNEALCAMRASVYLAAMGPAGIRQVAESSAAHAHYLADQLGAVPGFSLRSARPYFHEFLTDCPCDADELVSALARRGILAGLPVDGGILWCCTEMNTRGQIDTLVAAVREVTAR